MRYRPGYARCSMSKSFHRPPGSQPQDALLSGFILQPPLVRAKRPPRPGRRQSYGPCCSAMPARQGGNGH